MSVFELSFFIIPVFTQTIVYILDNKRAPSNSSYLGGYAFGLISLGLISLVGAFGIAPLIWRDFFFTIARIFLISGSAVWMCSQVSWIRRRVRIEKPTE